METKAMPKNTTQEERLDYLIEEFKASRQMIGFISGREICPD